MRHVYTRLKDADFQPFFGDCQTVRNWQDFRSMAARRWEVSLPMEFKPRHLFDLVTQLEDNSGKKIVILLDEIDQLLDWDQCRTSEEVPEAFFRACRTISQERAAQFVFSGERIIAKKMWDPQSPHWNFCRDLSLQQLNRDASDQLLLRPLTALQISIEDEMQFRDRSWLMTSGHPQILQFLGDSIVRRLNDRPSKNRSVIGPSDLDQIGASFEYREHYLTTYWGQAKLVERLISLLVVAGNKSVHSLIEALQDYRLHITEDQVMDALRMLKLYGILYREGPGYALRAEWYPIALISFGGLEQAIQRFVGELR